MSVDLVNREELAGTGVSPSHVSSFLDKIDELITQSNTTKTIADSADVVAEDAKEAATHGLAGFISGANNPDTDMSFDEGTRTLTIAPSGDSFAYWCGGIEYTQEESKSVIIDDEEGAHFVYFDDLDLKSTQTFFPGLITVESIVSIIVWDKVNQEAVKFTEERHGRVMTGETHLSFHLNPGTLFVHGCDLSFNTVDSGAPSDDTSSKVYIAEGSIRDEDINITSVNSATPANRWEQILGSNLTDDAAKLPLFYLEGASGYWRRWLNDSDRFSFLHRGGNTPPQFNEFTGGVWTLSDCTNRDFVVYYVCMDNDYNYPVFLMAGQQLYETLSEAEAATPTDLNWGVYDPAEIIVLHKLVFEYRIIYTNATHRCVLRQVESFNIRGATKVGLINSNQNHAALQNLAYETSGHTGFASSAYFATSDPTADNDEIDTADVGRVFTSGDFWYNNSLDKFFFCKDASAGAAVWKEIQLV